MAPPINQSDRLSTVNSGVAKAHLRAGGRDSDPCAETKVNIDLGGKLPTPAAMAHEVHGALRAGESGVSRTGLM